MLELEAIVLLASAVAFGVLLVAFFRRRRRPLVRITPPEATSDAAPLPPRAIPLVDVPGEAALAALPRPLRACPDCGFVGVRSPTMDDGMFAGGGELMGRVICPHCGYQGPPAEFDAGEDYAEYVAALHRAWRAR